MKVKSSKAARSIATAMWPALQKAGVPSATYPHVCGQVFAFWC